MKNNTQRGVINNIAIIIVLLIIVAVTGGVYVLYKEPSIVGDSRIDGAVNTASPSASSANDQKELVYLELEKKQFSHNNKVFEPVHYRLVNNSFLPVYFLSGCVVVLPEVYKVENEAEIRLLQQGGICDALPQVNKVEPSERVGLGWDQKVLGKFVEDGQYRVAIKYSLEKINDYTIGPTNEALSGVFTVIQVRWSVTAQRKICELFGDGFKTNGIIYTKDWCLKNLER